jgi:hypothetical protein
MALGFDDYGALTLARSADVEATLPFPSSFDFTGYTGVLQIRDTDTSPDIRLAVSDVASVNGSVITFSGNLIILTIKRADTRLLPEGDPYEGAFEWTVTDPAGLTSRMVIGPLIAQKGVVR